jgi:hypothetical protein
MSVDIKLSESEIRTCNYLGKLRNYETSKHASERKQDQSLNGEQMSINGVLTEYAVAKFLRLFFDIDCSYRKFGADLVDADGKLIDVKSTNTAGGNLNAVEWSTSKPVDVFVLTEIHPFHIRIVGWIAAEKFLRRENLRNVGNGLFYSVPQSQLTPFEYEEFNEQSQYAFR